MTTRRSFLRGAAAVVAAPLVCQASSLMPVKALKAPGSEFFLCEWVPAEEYVFFVHSSLERDVREMIVGRYDGIRFIETPVRTVDTMRLMQIQGLRQLNAIARRAFDNIDAQIRQFRAPGGPVRPRPSSSVEMLPHASPGAHPDPLANPPGCVDDVASCFRKPFSSTHRRNP